MVKQIIKFLCSIVTLSCLLWATPLCAAPVAAATPPAHIKKARALKSTKKLAAKQVRTQKKSARHLVAHTTTEHKVVKAKPKAPLTHIAKSHQRVKSKSTHPQLAHHVKHRYAKAVGHTKPLPAVAGGPQDYFSSSSKNNFADSLAQNNSHINEDLMNGGFNQMIKARILNYQTSICANAQAQIGKPYAWGGEDPDSGFDCSGLSQFVYAEEGIQIPRTALDQFHTLKPVKSLQEGDLVFFRTHDHSRLISHVGIYIGDGYFVHSPRTGETIRVSRLDDPYWHQHYAGARRVLTPHVVSRNVALSKYNAMQDDS